MDYLILSWQDVYNLTLRLSERIVKSGFVPDIIVGIARGGWIPARILSDVLYTSAMFNIRIEYYSSIGTKGETPIVTQPLAMSLEGKKVLLIDEIADTGDSLLYAIEHVKNLGAETIKSAVLYLKPTSKITPDFYISMTNSWVIFCWEFRESIITLVKMFKQENPTLDMKQIRDKLVFEVGYDPTVADYFIERL
ncbi:MAG: phosphoribosyltransferase [Candidatus Thorarchaeota archaeon]